MFLTIVCHLNRSLSLWWVKSMFSWLKTIILPDSQRCTSLWTRIHLYFPPLYQCCCVKMVELLQQRIFRIWKNNLSRGYPRQSLLGFDVCRTRRKTQRQTIYTSSGPRDRVIAFTSSSAWCLCVGLYDWVDVQGVLPTSFYRSEGRAIVLVLTGYNWRVLVLRLISLNVRLRRFLITWRSRHLVPCLQANLGPAQESSE
jgi:hypothetical protein